MLGTCLNSLKAINNLIKDDQIIRIKSQYKNEHELFRYLIAIAKIKPSRLSHIQISNYIPRRDHNNHYVGRMQHHMTLVINKAIVT